MNELARRKPEVETRVSSVGVKVGRTIYTFWDEKELTDFISDLKVAKAVSFP